MRAVLDTNVVVSALLWGGLPYRLMQQAIDGDLELFTSPSLVDELREILTRRHLTKKFNEQRTSVDELATLYLEFARAVSPLSTPRAVPRDVDDDQVVACALAAQANLIITGDQDLLVLNAYQGIDIVTPAQALPLISSG